MSIIQLLSELADTIRRSNRRKESSPQFNRALAEPVFPQNIQRSSVQAPPLSRFEMATDTLEPVAGSTAAILDPLNDGLQMPSSSVSVHMELDIAGFLPALYECTDGFNHVIEGVQSGDPTRMALGTERLLYVSSGIVGGALKISEIPAAEHMIPGVGLITNLVALADGIQWLYRSYGRRVAAQTIFVLLMQNPETAQIPLKTSILQSSANLKTSYFDNLTPLMGSMCWLSYKYRPDWFVEAQSVIQRLALPLLGLAAAIMSLIIIGTSAPSLGIVPIVISSAAAAIGIGFIARRGVKFLQSKQYFGKHILPFLSSQEHKELHFCLKGSHRLFGATVGDYFRYQIALMLLSDLQINYLNYDTGHNSLKRTTLHSTHKRVLKVTEMVQTSMMEALWGILRKDLGHLTFSKLHSEVCEHFRFMDRPYMNEQDKAQKYEFARLYAIKSIFSVLRVNN